MFITESLFLRTKAKKEQYSAKRVTAAPKNVHNIFWPNRACMHTYRYTSWLVDFQSKGESGPHSPNLWLCTYVDHLHSPELVFVVQESHCEMRVSLNQKPNSSKDFGFQAAWDSTGARVSSVQPGTDRDSWKKCFIHPSVHCNKRCSPKVPALNS